MMKGMTAKNNTTVKRERQQNPKPVLQRERQHKNKTYMIKGKTAKNKTLYD